NSAELTIQTTVQSTTPADAKCRIISEIVAPDGKSVASVSTEETVPTGAAPELIQKVKIENPKLWSLQSPHLYQLRTTIEHTGQPVDQAATTFGIRTIRFDPNKGFFLNGEHVKICGLACHHDFSAVGIAVPDSLQAWRVQQLKKLGCNAWRTA